MRYRSIRCVRSKLDGALIPWEFERDVRTHIPRVDKPDQSEYIVTVDAIMGQHGVFLSASRLIDTDNQSAASMTPVAIIWIQP